MSQGLALPSLFLALCISYFRKKLNTVALIRLTRKRDVAIPSRSDSIARDLSMFYVSLAHKHDYV
jgi:hypothetical protein